MLKKINNFTKKSLTNINDCAILILIKINNNKIPPAGGRGGAIC